MGALQVRHEPTSAALIRHHLRDELVTVGVPPDSLDMIVLVASELVGNAVRHTPPASGLIDVDWELDSKGLTVCVADASTKLPRPRRAQVHEVTGRGLAIVAAVADDWGVDTGPGGKQVWAHIAFERDSVSQRRSRAPA